MGVSNNYKSSALWKKYLSKQENDEHDSSRDRLRVAYDRFFENSKILSQQIQKDLPNLTLHDENHYNALWRQASKIWNVNIELTPLEVFILGCAILVHDLANSTYAFEKGIDSIKETAQWKDNEVFYKKKYNKEILDKDDEKDILLNVLRHIHANQAEKICEFKCKNDNNEFRIFEDDDLRTDLGELIGKIGASHHWNIDQITEELDEKIGAPSYLPDDWYIRPILIACLLRCADATQIDQARAPNFLYSLLNINGISKDHWLAQSRLSAPILDEKSNALIFNSSKSFEEKDANAWWLVFDALKMANGELISSNNVIKDIYGISFKAERIKDCESPDRLKKHIKTKDWEPVRAEVKISQPEKIIDMFSGKELYGENYFVPIRELIQNAADAIKKRRTIEKDFDGKIQINLRSGINDKGEEGHWLDIDDDGIGMSKNVLTGTLIDFGASYMSSSIAFDEYPGLIGNRPEQIGKFGIGFFSVFMISDDIDVISKPFDKGTNDYCKIKFRDGKKLRPLVSKQIENLSSNISTRISLFLNEINYNKIFNPNSEKIGFDIRYSLENIVNYICPLLDVDIHVNKTKIHKKDWYSADKFEWFNSISNISVSETYKSNLEIKDFIPNLRLIDVSNPSLGYAAIFPNYNCLIKTVGGLAAERYQHEESGIIGAIEMSYLGPSRVGGLDYLASTDILSTWAVEQYDLLKKIKLNIEDKMKCAETLCQFDVQAESFYYINCDNKTTTIYEIFDKLYKGDEFFLPVRKDGDDQYLINMRFLFDVFIYEHEIKYLLENTLEPFGINFYSSNSILYDYCNLDNVGFFSSLKNMLYEKGYNLMIEDIGLQNFATYIGETSIREEIYNGDVGSGHCYKMSAKKIT